MRAATTVRIGVGAAGVAMAGFGVWGALTQPEVGKPWAIGKWLIGGVLLHDAVLAPVVFAACAVAWRFTTVRMRRALAVLLLAGGSAALIALPDILRRGRNSNPTVTALDYPRNLTAVLGALLLAVLLFTVSGAVREQRRQRRLRIAAEAAEAEAEAEAEMEAEPEPESGSRDVDAPGPGDLAGEPEA
ncbi:MAG TPA: hypothetical protein VGM10_34685 [Actinocrinis sp.]|jgi:hypothetical protein